MLRQRQDTQRSFELDVGKSVMNVTRVVENQDKLGESFF